MIIQEKNPKKRYGKLSVQTNIILEENFADLYKRENEFGKESIFEINFMSGQYFYDIMKDMDWESIGHKEMVLGVITIPFICQDSGEPITWDKRMVHLLKEGLGSECAHHIQ
jgi:hypothetical protein